MFKLSILTELELRICFSQADLVIDDDSSDDETVSLASSSAASALNAEESSSSSSTSAPHFATHVIRRGLLMKRRPRTGVHDYTCCLTILLTGVFSTRLIELRGGSVWWTKLSDVKKDPSVVCRAID